MSSQYIYAIFGQRKQGKYELTNSHAADGAGCCSVDMLGVKSMYGTKNSN